MRSKVAKTGLLLLVLSAYPLVLMAREVVTGWQVTGAYSVEEVHDSLATSVGGHVVRLEDDLPNSDNRDERARTRVRIIVDGRDYSVPVEANARPAFRDANRYWGYISLKRLIERSSGKSSVVVAQALGAAPGAGTYSERDQRYRLLTVAADGRVKEDIFTYAQRGTPAVRVLLMDYVVPHPIGFHDDLMQSWPTLWYPLLYPWLSGLIGAIMVIASGLATLAKRLGV